MKLLVFILTICFLGSALCQLNGTIGFNAEMILAVEKTAKNIESITNYLKNIGETKSCIEENKSNVGQIEKRLNKIEAWLGLQGYNNEDERRRPKSFENEIFSSSGAKGGVYFNVISSKRTSCYACPVAYNEVMVDSHNAVDLTSGVFKAPISGDYAFQFHGLAEPGSEIQIEVVVNGVGKFHLYDHDTRNANSRYAMIGQAFMHKLSKGDEVSVHLHRGALKGGRSATYTSFMGFSQGSLKVTWICCQSSFSFHV